MVETVVKNNESEKSRKDETTLADLRRWAEKTADERIKQEVLWFELQLLKDGDHFTVIPDRDKNRATTLKVRAIKRRRGEIMRVVNKFRALIRILKATTAATDMRWEVPGGDENEILASNYLNWFRDKDKIEPFAEVVSDVVEYGFMRSVGYFDPYWDPQLAKPVVRSRDPFDLLMDRYEKKARRTYILREEEVRKGKDSDDTLLFKETGALNPTTRQSGSEVFDNYLATKYPRLSQSEEDDKGDIMMEEFHELEQVDEAIRDESDTEAPSTDGKGPILVDVGEFVVRMTTTSKGSEKIHDKDFYVDEELRFIPYHPERRPNDIYNEPWMKDAMDPQRSIDNVFSHMEEFIRTMGKGRLLKRKGQVLDKISDRDGQIVEYDGEKPEFADPRSMGNDQFKFFEIAELMMEDVVGIHPSQIRKTETARGIGFLIALDQTNISEPFKNLQNALVKVGHKILALANKHMMSTEDIFWFQDGKRTSAKVISGQATNKPDGVKEILNPDSLTVELVPRGQFAALAKEEKIISMAQAGVIRSPGVILKALNAGNVSELLEEEMKFREENPEPVAGQGGPQGAVAPPTTNDTNIRDVAAKAVADLKNSGI